jgi:transposase-like protein
MSTSPSDLPASPGLTVAAVARRLGVAPATLRTWDRRYGLGPSEHSAGSHRRYSTADVARLDLMRRMVNAGAAPAGAAQAALAADVSAVTDLAPPLVHESVYGTLPALEGDHSAADDRVVPLPTATAAVRGLGRAAASLDPLACTAIVRDSLDRRGVVWTWDNLVVPVLHAVGAQWEDTGRGVEVEHLLSEAVIAALAGVSARLRHPVNPRPVLLACAPEELHSLPLFAVAAALAERQVAARVLGARVPHDALVAAIRRTGPSAVLLWSYLPFERSAESLEGLPVLRPAPLVLAAGPGWGSRVPEGAGRVHDLVEAVTALSRAAEG